MKFFAWLLVVAYILLPSNVKAQAPQYIQNKSGGKMEIVSAVAEGDFLVIELKQGQMKLPKSGLGPETVAKYFPDTPAIATQAPPREPQAVSLQTKEEISSPIAPDAHAPAKPVAVSTIPDTLPDSLPALPSTSEAQIFSAEKVSFEIESMIPGNEKVKIQALVPKDKAGKIPASASNVVFYAPHIGDRNLHAQRTGHDQRIFWELCENFGMTVFTAEFNIKVEDVDDRKKCYYYPESGSPKVVFAAREKLLRDNRLSKRKMFVIGNSGGSSMAQRLGLLYSNDIAAVAMMGGGRFDPVQRSVNIPWLILNTRGDPRAPQNVELVQQLRAHGMNALYAETEPWATKKEDFLKQHDHNFHHTSSDLGFDLMKRFIVDAVAHQGDRIPRPLNPSQWPFFSSTISPFLVHPTSGETGNKNLFEARLFFPSQDFAKLWQAVPYRTLPVYPEKTETGTSILAIVRYPPVEVLSKGIVVFNAGKNEDVNLAADYLDFMALKGYIGVTYPFSNSEKKMLEESKTLLAVALKEYSESSLPFYLAGLGSGGRHMLIVGSECGDKKVKGVLAVDAELEWPFPGLSPITRLPLSKVKTFFLAFSSEMPEKAIQEKAFQEAVEANKLKIVSKILKNISTTAGFDGLECVISEMESSVELP